jgi:chromosome segregation ATPase
VQQQEKEIQALRKALDEAKDLRNRAEVKLEALERQEKEILRELEELGVEPDRLDEEIERLEREIDEKIKQAWELIPVELIPSHGSKG